MDRAVTAKLQRKQSREQKLMTQVEAHENSKKRKLQLTEFEDILDYDSKYSVGIDSEYPGLKVNPTKSTGSTQMRTRMRTLARG